MLFIAGAARAKGFWLEGYGVFFDVDVPAMRRSVAWQFRALDRGDRAAAADDPVAPPQPGTAVPDPQARREIEEALQRLAAERRAAAAAAGSRYRGTARGSLTCVDHAKPWTGRRRRHRRLPLPAEAARRARSRRRCSTIPGVPTRPKCKSALIDAMLDFGPPSRWPTVSGSRSPRATTTTHAWAAAILTTCRRSCCAFAAPTSPPTARGRSRARTR